jgi:acyl-CoA synthetase (AMP-forming)/AMP-acid ligase II
VTSGEVGTVRMRSAAVMRGYVGSGSTIDRPATDAVLDHQGWVTTGDLGRMGSDGNLRLVGRSTEMIIRGGYNVYPSEVEAVLGNHPAIAQVSVVGAPDPVLGEIIFAFVVLRPRSGSEGPPEGSDRTDGPGGSPSPGLEELRILCKGSLADYKAPDRLELLQELPTTPIGKVDLRALARLAEERVRERAEERSKESANERATT